VSLTLPQACLHQPAEYTSVDAERIFSVFRSRRLALCGYHGQFAVAMAVVVCSCLRISCGAWTPFWTGFLLTAMLLPLSALRHSPDHPKIRSPLWLLLDYTGPPTLLQTLPSLRRRRRMPCHHSRILPLPSLLSVLLHFARRSRAPCHHLRCQATRISALLSSTDRRCWHRHRRTCWRRCGGHAGIVADDVAGIAVIVPLARARR
jgi:hypothetical protein